VRATLIGTSDLAFEWAQWYPLAANGRDEQA
jgi:hypothetical protein